MMYRTCEYCGAHLDFGETCECISHEHEEDSAPAEESEDKKEPVAI